MANAHPPSFHSSLGCLRIAKGCGQLTWHPQAPLKVPMICLEGQGREALARKGRKMGSSHGHSSGEGRQRPANTTCPPPCPKPCCETPLGPSTALNACHVPHLESSLAVGGGDATASSFYHPGGFGGSRLGMLHAADSPPMTTAAGMTRQVRVGLSHALGPLSTYPGWGG